MHLIYNSIITFSVLFFLIKYPFDGGSNAPNRGGKGSTWEGGSHVPAIFWMPSLIPSFSTCMSPILNLDILPTLAELIGFQLPTNRTYDGVSILNKISSVNQCNDRKTDPHKFTYYWRTGLLYAMRYYQYKAHWITRNGFGLEPPIHHSPPLMYNLEWDSAESIPLNANLTENYAQILKIMEEQYAKITQEINGEMTQNVAQFNRQDWRIVPCCGKKFNITEAKEFAEEGEIGLAIWDECVCNLKP